MEYQDWTTVTSRRTHSKKDSNKCQYIIQSHDSEKTHTDKLVNNDYFIPIKRVSPESLQMLIRKRIELGLSQEKADVLCSFPRNTFKEIEANRLVPSEEQKCRIHQKMGIQLKTNT